MFRRVLPRAAPLVAALLLLSLATACRGVGRAQMASMPPQTYHIEYYLLSPR